MGKRKVVLDTNILISALGWEGSPHSILKRAIDGEIDLFVSHAQFDELSRVLNYPRFGFTEDQKSRFKALISKIATFVKTDVKLDIVKDDPSDNRILECALVAGVDFGIDPKRTALVIIDLQKGIAAMGRETAPYPTHAVIQNASKLAKAFRNAGALVVPVHVASKDGKDMLHPITDSQPWSGNRSPDFAEFVPELEVSDADHPVTKLQWGAFYGTDLDLQLRRRGIDTVVLCGISTNIGVEATARDAYQHGYNQIFVEDAMCAMSREEHEGSVKFIFPRMGLVRNTEEVLSAVSKK